MQKSKLRQARGKGKLIGVGELRQARRMLWLLCGPNISTPVPCIHVEEIVCMNVTFSVLVFKMVS